MSQEDKMDTLALFRSLAEFPTYSSATILNDTYAEDDESHHESGDEIPDPKPRAKAVNLQLSTRSYLLSSRLKHTRTIPLSDDIPSYLFPATELPPRTIEFFSSSQGYKGLLKVVEEKRIVEVWDLKKGTRVAEKDVTEDCGDFLDDETWGSPSFSPDYSKLLFSAHRLPHKKNDDLSKRKRSSPFETHAFTPTWGELNRNLIFPTIFVFSWSNNPLIKSKDRDPPTCRPIISRSLDSTISFGQGQFFVTNGVEGVVTTGYETMEDGRRLGIVYCTNRRSGVWRVNLESEEMGKGDGVGMEGLQRLSDEERSARSPRVLTFPEDYPRQRDALLVYLSNELGGAHGSCATLHRQTLAASFDRSSRVNDTIILKSEWEPEFFDPQDPLEPTFWAGLYVSQLPQSPFILLIDPESAYNNDETPLPSPRLVFHTINYSFSLVCILNLDIPGPSIPMLYLDPHEPDDGTASSVLGTDGRSSMAVLHSRIDGSKVQVHNFEIEEHEFSTIIKEIVPSSILTGGEVLRSIWRIKARVVPSLINPRTSSTIFLSSSELPPSLKSYDFSSETNRTSKPLLPLPSSPPPLILSPHGGPHSTTLQTFSPSNLALASEGYTLALVNYTGSLGFGQKAVEELRGKCGDLDVRECEEVIDRWVEAWTKEGWKGGWEGKIFVVGGSHGGFLTAHLQTRCKLITASILRNPVISLGENLTITDIPDWVFAELAIPYSLSSSQQRPSITPTMNQFATLQSRSPISKVDQVSSHTLLLMGMEDRRVPPSQTKAWYHSLKGRSDRIKKTNAAASGGEGKESKAKKEEFEVECLAFEGEGHALDGVEAELKSFEATLEWFGRWAKF